MGDANNNESPNTEQNNNVSSSVTFTPENKSDGYISVTFAERDLEALADFFPPKDQGAPINDQYIEAALEKLNIKQGLRWDDIRAAALVCNQEKRAQKNVVIARGTEPVAEVMEFFAMNPNFGVEKSQNPLDRIDYRAKSPFIIVKQDQILARKTPKKEGREGMDVHGNALPFKTLRPEGVTGGANTRTDENCIYANINGQLLKVNNTLEIQDSLVIKGSVGYGTGNIVFPGDVTIEGSVSDGFKIHSGGSVVIKQTFDVTEASAKGDLTVAGGIIGRGKALIKVGGSLRGKFIENCRVACRKTIKIETEIVNSKLYAMETLEMGEKGVIIGGFVYAIRGVKLGSVGRKTGRHTEIHCGVDFTVQQEKEKRNSQLQVLTAKAERLKEMLENPPEPYDPEKRKTMEALLVKMEAERRKLVQRISDLLAKIIGYEDAAVEVSGEIAPGTLIEICQVELEVTEPLRRVRIKLDKASGKLVNEPL